MSKNWGVAAGIGQGVMQGLGFLRQMDADKRSQQMLENQSEVLGMQKDIHREKMGEITRQNEDRVRTDLLNTLSTRIDSVYKDLPAHERKQMLLDMGSSMGQMKPADIETVTKARDALVDKFGETAVTALAAGNIDPMRSVLKTQNIDLQSDPKTGKYLVKLPGSTEPVALDQKGIFGMDVLSGYRSRQDALKKAELERIKMQADIDNKNADTLLKNRLPQDRVGGVGGGRGAGGKDDKAFDPIGNLEDFNKAIGNDPETGKPPIWAPTALQHYQQLQESNLALANSKAGGQAILNMAIALGKGHAQAVPDIDANGNVQLVAAWPGENGRQTNRMVLQNNIDMSDPSMVQGVGGKQIVTPAEWGKIQTNAIQNYARQRPQEYALVAPIAANDDQMARLEAAAQKDPSAARQYRFAKLIREQIQQTPEAGGAERQKKPISKEDAQVAASLGIDPDDPGLSGRISKLANRFTSAITGYRQRSSADTIESQLRMLQRNPNDRSVREWLFANSVGNPELQARILELTKPSK